MESTLKILGAALMAAIAVLQFFINWLALPWMRWVVVGMAVLGLISFGIADWIHRRARQRWEAEQPEKIRRLIDETTEQVIKRVKASESLKAVVVAEQIPEKAEIDAGLLSTSEPRVYVGIELAKESMFRRTPFTLHNRGKDTAHAITIQPFKLARKPVVTTSLEVLHGGEDGEVLPTIEKDDGMMAQNDVFHWLLKDWNQNGEMVEEWPVPLTVTYLDFNRVYEYKSTMTLVFHPIAYILEEKHNWPDYKDTLWEMRDVKFEKRKLT